MGQGWQEELEAARYISLQSEAGGDEHCRRGFDSQHPHNSSQPFIIPVPGDPKNTLF